MADGGELWSGLLDALFQRVWRDVLAGSMRAPQRTGCVAEDDGPWMGAQIRICGDLDACVRLACPRATAREFAASFLRRPATELTGDDLNAALAELVNVFGGNLKGALRGAHSLGLPEPFEPGAVNTLAGDGRGLQLEFHGWRCWVEVERSGGALTDDAIS